MGVQDDPIAQGAIAGATAGSVVGPWGTLIGGVAGAGLGVAQKDSLRRRRKSQTRLANARLASQVGGRESAITQAKKGLEARTKSFDAAEKRTSKALRAAKRKSIDRQKEIAATLQARFGGNSQTTAYQNALSGLSHQTTRELEQVDAAFANQLANLAIGRGESEAMGRNQIGSLMGNLGDVKGDYYSTLAGIDSDFRLDPYQFAAGTMAGAQVGSQFGG